MIYSEREERVSKREKAIEGEFLSSLCEKVKDFLSSLCESLSGLPEKVLKDFLSSLSEKVQLWEYL